MRLQCKAQSRWTGDAENLVEIPYCDSSDETSLSGFENDGTQDGAPITLPCKWYGPRSLAVPSSNGQYPTSPAASPFHLRHWANITSRGVSDLRQMEIYAY